MSMDTIEILSYVVFLGGFIVIVIVAHCQDRKARQAMAETAKDRRWLTGSD